MPQARTAILIAAHNEAKVITKTVRKARATGSPVYVVSDGSSDETASLASGAGAIVCETEGRGKPAALRYAARFYRLFEKYEYIAVIDADTYLEPDFIYQAEQKLSPGVICVIGRCDAYLPRRFTPWQGVMSAAIWRYNVFLRRGQSATNTLNVISGASSLFRSSFLQDVLARECPLLVDDTFWLITAKRENLGKVVYQPLARCYAETPKTLPSLLKQQVRWIWGTMQGIVYGKAGIRPTKWDLAYLGQMADWTLYSLLSPVIFILIGSRIGYGVEVLGTIIGAFASLLLASTVLKRPTLVIMLPFVLVFDLIYRGLFVYCLLKTIQQPTVKECKWVSPAR